MNRPPPNRHTHFFSSLKQVEKRPKLEKPGTHTHTSTESLSLSSPLFLNINPPNPSQTSTTFNNDDDTESIAREFLTNSYTCPQSHQNPLPKSPQDSPPRANFFDVDEIGLLIDLLGLSDSEGNNSGLEKCFSCNCEGGFYERIVGVKGPKCGKEVERLEGWVEWFRRENGEPLRLAHLLLGKAAFGNSEGLDEEIEFPSTIDEFLQCDPPLE